MPTLRIVVSRHSAFYSPLIAAVAGGFLEQEGIEGCYLGVPAHGSVVRSLVAREAHVGQSAVSASWTILEQGLARADRALRADQPARRLLHRRAARAARLLLERACSKAG